MKAEVGAMGGRGISKEGGAMGNMWIDEINKDKIGHMYKNLIMKPVMFHANLIICLFLFLPPAPQTRFFVLEAVSHVVQVGPLTCCVAEVDLELIPTVSTSSGLALQVSTSSLTFFVCLILT